MYILLIFGWGNTVSMTMQHNRIDVLDMRRFSLDDKHCYILLFCARTNLCFSYAIRTRFFCIVYFV